MALAPYDLWGPERAYLHLGWEDSPKPDTLKQTDRLVLSIKSLADGAGHTFLEGALIKAGMLSAKR